MRRRKKSENGGFNVWRSYSDMMAGVLLLFVLLMCVTLFQAQKSYDESIKERDEKIALQEQYTLEILAQQNELDEKEGQLKDQNQQLKTQDEKLKDQEELLAQLAAKLKDQEATLNQNELDEKEGQLKDQNQQLKTQDEKLKDQEELLAQLAAKLKDQEATLNSQQAALNEKTALLKDQQAQIDQIIGVKADVIEALKKEFAKNNINVDIDTQTGLNEKTALLKDQQAQIDQIIGVKADVIEALKKEFAKNNINVDIDTQTGAMTLESSVLFAYDEAELTEEGKQALEQVLPIYCKVLLQKDYMKYLAEIIIDGYTDTDGDYSYNLQLSQQRSLAVAQYLLNIQGNFLNSDQSQNLQEYLTVNGHSMANPVLDANGNVDKDASRRVEVKFRLKDEEMISELNKIMSAQGEKTADTDSAS